MPNDSYTVSIKRSVVDWIKVDYVKVEKEGSNATHNDTDDDSLLDGEEVEGWNIFVDGEVRHVTSSPVSVHGDGDGLRDVEEISIYYTDPSTSDTDGDLIWDNYEVNHPKLDALDSADAKEFLIEFKNAIRSLPEILQDYSFWMSWEELNEAMCALIEEGTHKILPDPTTFSLSTFIEFAEAWGLMSSVAATMFAGALALISLAYAIDFWEDVWIWCHARRYMFDGKHNPGYVHQIGWGTKWDDDISNKLSTLGTYYSQQIVALNYLIYKTETVKDPNQDGSAGFKYILFLNEKMIDVFGEKRSPEETVNLWLIEKNVTDTGYELEHMILKFCERIQSEFGYITAYIGVWGGTCPQKKVRVCDAAKDLVGIGYTLYMIVQLLRISTENSLEYSS